MNECSVELHHYSMFMYTFDYEFEFFQRYLVVVVACTLSNFGNNNKHLVHEKICIQEQSGNFLVRIIDIYIFNEIDCFSNQIPTIILDLHFKESPNHS